MTLYVITERQGLLKKDRTKFIPYIEYMESELKFLPEYERKVDWKVYQHERNKRLEIERWVECLINATLDLSKMFLSFRGEGIPETSREVLYKIASFVFEKESDAEAFSQLAKIRNTLAHRYLDIRWQDIKIFIKLSPKLYPEFMEHIKTKIGLL